MIKIGVFDSGIGGLSIVKECIAQSAYGEYIYLYDNKYHPYGGRSKEELAAIAFVNIKSLIDRGAEVIILACNTITSAAIEDMRKTFSLPIIGTEPAIKPACRECSKVAVLATPYMVSSARMTALVIRYKSVKFRFPDCSGLATAVEYGFNNIEMMRDKFGAALQRVSDCDGIVLGCTHYNFARDIIAEIMPNARIYDSALGVARRLKSCMSPLHWEKNEFIIRIITTNGDIDTARRVMLNDYLGKAIIF